MVIFGGELCNKWLYSAAFPVQLALRRESPLRVRMPPNLRYSSSQLISFSKRLLGVLAVAGALPPTLAQNASIYQEQGKLIRAPQAVTRLGPELFGDKVNL
jgi:hypothetical protein